MEVHTEDTTRDRRRRRAGRFVLALSRDGTSGAAAALQLIELRKTRALSRAFFYEGPLSRGTRCRVWSAARNRYRIRFSSSLVLILSLSLSLYRYFFPQRRYVEIQNDQRPQRYECNNRTR